MRWPTPLTPIIIAKLLGGSGGGSVTTALANALLDWCAHTAFTDDQGQTYYDNLLNALYPIQSIAAVYTQSGTVYDTDSLDSLKTDLTVTATYEDGTTAVIPASDYTLSGTLTVGTSTITVTYLGKTETFTVTVTEGVPSGYTKVDYLEKPAGEKDYINTELFYDPSFAVCDFDFEFSTTNDGENNEQGMGERQISPDTSFTGNFAWFFAPSTKTFGVRAQPFGSGSQTDVGSYVSGTVRHVAYRYNNGAATISLDGATPVPVDNVPQTISQNTTYPLGLCGIANGVTGEDVSHLSDATGKTKWGSVTISKNGETLYRFLPAYNGTKYGYYEKVNDVFYPSVKNHVTGGNY